MDPLTELKQVDRLMWATGDYEPIGDEVAAGPDAIVRHTGVRRGDRVLDVACGTGNTALRAAARGAEVAGLDLTPELLVRAQARADAMGVDVEWIEGDAEALPFEDESFDVVLSSFGCMFAPRHEVAAAELARVLRPGGRMGLCTWTPEGAIGDFFETLGAQLPPPPEDFQPPLLWGGEEHVRRLFEGSGVDLEFEREMLEIRYDSPEVAVNTYATKFGPVMMARQLAEAEGRWPEMREAMLAMCERNNASDGDDLRMPSEYLVVLGRKH